MIIFFFFFFSEKSGQVASRTKLVEGDKRFGIQRWIADPTKLRSSSKAQSDTSRSLRLKKSLYLYFKFIMLLSFFKMKVDAYEKLAVGTKQSHRKFKARDFKKLWSKTFNFKNLSSTILCLRNLWTISSHQLFYIGWIFEKDILFYL